MLSSAYTQIHILVPIYLSIYRFLTRSHFYFHAVNSTDATRAAKVVTVKYYNLSLKDMVTLNQVIEEFLTELGGKVNGKILTNVE